MTECSNQQCIYLITYSGVDLNRVKSREDFSALWTKAFGEDMIKQWACYFANHKESGQLHFHLCLKPRRLRRWKSLKPNVIDEAGVVCNIQKFHSNYYDAFCYAKKGDADYINYIRKAPSTEELSTDKKSPAKWVLITSPDDLRVPPRPVKKTKNQRRDTVKVYDIMNNGLKTERDKFLLANSEKQKKKETCWSYSATFTAAEWVIKDCLACAQWSKWRQPVKDDCPWDFNGAK